MTAIIKTHEELLDWRAELLVQTGMSEELLVERGESFDLYPEHRAAYQTIRSIDWLLDKDAP